MLDGYDIRPTPDLPGSDKETTSLTTDLKNSTFLGFCYFKC